MSTSRALLSTINSRIRSQSGDRSSSSSNGANNSSTNSTNSNRRTVRARYHFMTTNSSKKISSQVGVVLDPSSIGSKENNDDDDDEEIYTVAVVGTRTCVHCRRAKAALDRAGIKYQNILLEELPEDGERVLSLSRNISGMRTIPQIYVNEECIGGADECVELIRTGDLRMRMKSSNNNTKGALPEIIMRELLKEKICGANDFAEECEVDISNSKDDDDDDAYNNNNNSNATANTKTTNTTTTTTTTKKEQEKKTREDIKFADEIPFDGLVHIIDMARADPVTAGGLKLVETKRKTLIPFFPNKHQRTFSAERFIQWLITREICADRKAALDVGQIMVNERLMHSIDRTDAFNSNNDPRFGINGYQKTIFRFQKDEVEIGIAGLNSEFIFRGVPRDSTTVANDLRRRILDLYGSFLNSDGTYVDYEGMKDSEKFKEYKAVAAELQMCDPRVLNRNDRMAFFINVYNALIVHATIVKGVPDDTFKRLKFFDEAKYDIGGLQYSANDIEHGVLRSNRPSPAAIGVLLGKPELSRGPFKVGDARRECCITPMNPRIHFALVCGAKSCPPIRVFKGDQIDEQLEDAAFSFIQSDVEVDYRCSLLINRADGKFVDDKQERPCIVDEIRASKIIAEWYKSDFGKTNFERLQFIQPYMKDDEAKEALQYILERTKGQTGNGEKSLPVIKGKPYDWTSNGKKKDETRSGPDFNVVKEVYIKK